MNTKYGKGLTKRWIRIVLSTLILFFFIKYSTVFYQTANHYNQLQTILPDLPAYFSKQVQKNIVFPEKKWLHRVDSEERAFLMSNKYKGIEIDILYDTLHHCFDVRHPPAPSIGLSLEKMLASIPNVDEHYFWLDYKNLNDSNKVASGNLLLAIVTKYHLLNKIIVESDQPEALSWFTKHGFYTSYYIPTFDLSTVSKKEITEYYLTVKSHLKNSEVNALSAQSRSLPFIERYFPNYDILLWHLDDTKGFNYYTALWYLNFKNNVKVVLINEDSNGYR